uniref:Uncharacterized protein n=1 Tax=Glossina morsitans morsitans TaxID=37546 RepID=A0A1B0FJC8_GLOMM
MKRAEVAVLKAQPVGRRDQLAILQAQCRVGEYVRDAQNCEAKIAEWRLQLLPAAQQGKGGEGTITSSRGPHILVRLDGDDFSVPFHPTWKMRYLDSAQVQQHKGDE